MSKHAKVVPLVLPEAAAVHMKVVEVFDEKVSSRQSLSFPTRIPHDRVTKFDAVILQDDDFEQSVAQLWYNIGHPSVLLDID